MLILIALAEILTSLVAAIEWVVLGIVDLVLGLRADKLEPDRDEPATSHPDFPNNL